MLYHGIDLIEIARIERALQRWGDRFLTRLFTPDECAHYRERIASLAARFAAKEAVAKLLGVGLRGPGAGPDAVEWTDIEILSDSLGRPQLRLFGRAAERAALLDLQSIAVSLSHTHTLAIASATALAKMPESAD